jgi:hypothetical protein
MFAPPSPAERFAQELHSPSPALDAMSEALAFLVPGVPLIPGKDAHGHAALLTVAEATGMTIVGAGRHLKADRLRTWFYANLAAVLGPSATALPEDSGWGLLVTGSARNAIWEDPLLAWAADRGPRLMEEADALSGRLECSPFLQRIRARQTLTAFWCSVFLHDLSATSRFPLDPVRQRHRWGPEGPLSPHLWARLGMIYPNYYNSRADAPITNSTPASRAAWFHERLQAWLGPLPAPARAAWLEHGVHHLAGPAEAMVTALALREQAEARRAQVLAHPTARVPMRIRLSRG